MRAAPATAETGADSWGDGTGVTVLPGVLPVEETLGGDGTAPVAAFTRPLSQAAAAEVVTAIAPVLHACSGPAIERAVAAAIATHRPELLAEKTHRARDAWEVTLGHDTPEGFTGTSWLQATGDTRDLTACYDRVCAIAADLHTRADRAQQARPTPPAPPPRQDRQTLALPTPAGRHLPLALPPPPLPHGHPVGTTAHQPN